MIIDPFVEKLLLGFLSSMPAIIGASAILFKQNEEINKRSNVRKDLIETKTDLLITKTAEIHDLTDGNLTRIMKDLSIANERILKLESYIIGQKDLKLPPKVKEK